MIEVVILDVILIVILLMLGVPIVFCFGGALLFMCIFGNTSMISLTLCGFSAIINPVLLAIPLFIFAGGVLSESGVAERLLNLINVFVGRIKGGIGVVATVTCAVIGAISGSAFTGIAAIGPVLIPRMAKEGYPRGYATSLVTCSSILGLLIPPSALMIIYGWVTETSILACFLATVGPGLLIVVAFSAINLIAAHRMPDLVLEPPMNLIERGRRLLSCTWHAAAGLMMPIIILGGIYGGIFTPTEAAAVAAVYCIPVGFLIYRGLNMRGFLRITAESSTSIGTIMVIIFLCFMLTQTFIMARVPQAIIAFMFSVTGNKYLLLFIINMFLFFLGMIMSDVAGIIIAAPLLLPLVIKLGVSPVQFAAIIGTNLAIGGVTPPYANVLYLGMRVGEVEFTDVLKPTIKFVLFGGVPVVFAATYWPDLSLFLPRLLGFVP